MKLPGEINTGVQSLGQVNITAPLAIANAKQRNAELLRDNVEAFTLMNMAEKGAETGLATTNYFAEFAHGQSVIKNNPAWKKDETWNGIKVSDLLTQEQKDYYEDKDTIPAHEIMVPMMMRFTEDLTSKYTKNMNAKQLNSFNNTIDTKVGEGIGEVTTQSIEYKRTYIDGTSMQTYNNSIKQMDPVGAAKAAKFRLEYGLDDGKEFARKIEEIPDRVKAYGYQLSMSDAKRIAELSDINSKVATDKQLTPETRLKLMDDIRSRRSEVYEMEKREHEEGKREYLQLKDKNRLVLEGMFRNNKISSNFYQEQVKALENKAVSEQMASRKEQDEFSEKIAADISLSFSTISENSDTIESAKSSMMRYVESNLDLGNIREDHYTSLVKNVDDEVKKARSGNQSKKHALRVAASELGIFVNEASSYYQPPDATADQKFRQVKRALDIYGEQEGANADYLGFYNKNKHIWNKTAESAGGTDQDKISANNELKGISVMNKYGVKPENTSTDKMTDSQKREIVRQTKARMLDRWSNDQVSEGELLVDYDILKKFEGGELTSYSSVNDFVMVVQDLRFDQDFIGESE